jgi:coatomer subunit beta
MLAAGVGHEAHCTILLSTACGVAASSSSDDHDKGPLAAIKQATQSGGGSGGSLSLQQRLESEDPLVKADALREIIVSTVNGQPMPRLLMPVLKFCINTKDHNLKKLLLVYWEVVDKVSPDSGRLLPEMILVCNALRNDLQHPNEYIRGITLRFLCKIKHAEILEPLIPAVLECLKHRHSYVRKNAVITVFEIHQTFKDHLIPDAPQIIEDFLNEEPNMGSKRNAFLVLFHIDQARAVRYLATVIDQLNSMADSFQMVFLELARKVARSNPKAKPYYLRAVYGLLNSNSNTVSFEAANTLLSLSGAPTAVRAAVQALCQLLMVDSDNNVKLIIIGKLDALRTRQEKVLQEKLMDILRVVVSPNFDIRKKVLNLALHLVSLQNIEDVVSFLKKEIVRAENSDESHSSDYKKLLVQTVYECAVKFPHVASSVVHLLMSFVGDERSDAALDVILFIREIVQEYSDLRVAIVSKLIDSFHDIKASPVFHAALWVIGEFARDPQTLQNALKAIRSSIGDLPLAYPSAVPVEEAKESKSDAPHHVYTSKPVVLADGTYAQQSAYEVVDHSEKKVGGVEVNQNTLRGYLLRGDFYLGAAIANALTKLSLRASSLANSPAESNKEIARALLYITAILRLGTSAPATDYLKRIDEDSHKRIANCVDVLLNHKDNAASQIFLDKCRETFGRMVWEKREAKKAQKNPKSKEIVSQPDDLINLRQLKGRQPPGEVDFFEDTESDLTRAVGDTGAKDDFASRLQRIVQLTGYSDAVYAEACVTVHEYDIVLDLLLINQTEETLQNVSVELNTSGDLKLVERPQGYTIAPYGFKSVEANIKVSSTESGVIFGNIVYDTTGSTKEKNIIVLASIHMDIIDYISKEVAPCTEADFRKMWAEFEWENKVTVTTSITNLHKYLEHLIHITQMKCLTSAGGEYDHGTIGFLASNLYTKSIFGEDALLNLSIEKTEDGKVAGHIRIRSKTQGIALSLGDKITSKQRF